MRENGSMMRTRLLAIGMLSSLSVLLPHAAIAQQADQAAVIRMVDANVRRRVDRVLAFTDIERYSVYRGDDQTHAVATMTARDSYTKGEGKRYRVLAQTGSGIVQKFGLRPLLENEEQINKSANVQHSWFTSANYEMKLKPGAPQQVNGRGCYALAIKPRQKAPNMIEGTLWVDARDGSIAQVDGVASKSPSPFAGTTHMMRAYANVDGFPMAVHARAESKSALFGRSMVVTDSSATRPDHTATGLDAAPRAFDHSNKPRIRQPIQTT